jgi:hypothetical protein
MTLRGDQHEPEPVQRHLVRKYNKLIDEYVHNS